MLIRNTNLPTAASGRYLQRSKDVAVRTRKTARIAHRQLVAFRLQDVAALPPASSYNGESGGNRGSRFSMKAFMPSRHSGPSISMASASRPMFRAVVRSVSPHSRTAIFD